MSVVNIILGLLRLVVGSGIIGEIKKAVEEIENYQIPGEAKKKSVWRKLENSPELRDKVGNTASHLINLAIEAAVSVVKRV